MSAGERIGIVIVAHGGFAAELLKATEHVVGALPAARAIGLEPKDDLAVRRRDIESAISEVDTGTGVIVLTDLFGGTPSNLAIAAMAREGVDVITGANLPMMMKLAKSRHLPREEAVAAVVEAGKRYIIAAGSMLETRAK
ncbi:MAG: PTS fructose transporter subunit IIA [Neomegalonema sp.]|nr:PTS fructose transporter subunit IIA [Neomegalonema sp.]